MSVLDACPYWELTEPITMEILTGRLQSVKQEAREQREMAGLEKPSPLLPDAFGGLQPLVDFTHYLWVGRRHSNLSDVESYAGRLESVLKEMDSIPKAPETLFVRSSLGSEINALIKEMYYGKPRHMDDYKGIRSHFQVGALARFGARITQIENTFRHFRETGSFGYYFPTPVHTRRNSRVPPNAPLTAEEINYEVLGAENPTTVVLIHGHGGNLEDFRQLATGLSETKRVIIYDRRGGGKTVTRGNDYSLESEARDLKSLLDHLNVEKAHVLGHSTGGQIAAKFASLFPKTTSTLLIEDMEFRPLKNQLKYQDMFRSNETELEKVSEWSKLSEGFRSREEANAELTRLFGHFQAQQMLNQQLRVHPDGKFSLSGTPDQFALKLKAALDTDLTSTIRLVSSPTLVVKAQYGSDIADGGIQHMKTHFQEILVGTIPNSSHGIHHSNPDVFLKIISKFIDRFERQQKDLRWRM